MAKKLKDEDLVLNIIINGNKSKKEMNELERAITDTNREINTLKRVQKDLIAQGKKETEAYKATVVAIEQKNKAIAMAEARLTELRKGLKLTEMSMSDLRKEQKRLKQLMDTSIPNSDNYDKYKKQLEDVTGRLDELRGKAKDTGFSLKDMAGKFNHYIGVITAGIVTLMGLISGLQAIITAFAEFDDKLADVQKTTGLSRDAVLGLNEELKKIDTRTSQEDLLGLSRVAGKLGIEGSANILGFVKASDQIAVALSEDLGGDVEEAINSVGKLVDIFKVKEQFGIEQSLLKVGSVINELGAASTANEGYLVEFTKRMAGVAPLAGITIQQVLGIGATLDQFGQTAEVSSTSLSNLFLKMASDSGKFAKYTGLSLSQFKKSLNSDFTETFIKVLEGVRSTSGGINELAATLGDLDQDGSRTIGVLGVLANNTDVLRDQIKLANNAFKEGTSITNEFSIKNETAAAKMDKARKVLYNLTVDLGEKLNPVVGVSVNGFTYLVKILSELVNFVIENRKAIMGILTAFVAYNSVMIISNALSKQGIIYKQVDLLLFKAQYYWLNITTAANHLLSAAIARKNGNLALARTHMLAFNAATAANPLTIFLAAVVAVAAALVVYNSELSETEKIKKSMISIQEKANKNANDEKNVVKDLVSQLNAENATRGEKEAVIERLREIMPDYLSGYTNEEILAGKAKAAIESYIDTLDRRTRAEAANERIRELQKRNIELTNKDGSTRDGFMGAVNEGFQTLYGAVGLDSQVKRLQKNNIEDFKKEIVANNKEINAIKSNYGSDMAANNLGFGTVEGMKATVRQMGIELSKMKKGSKEYVELTEKIAARNKVIAEMEKAKKKTDAPIVLGETEEQKKARLKAEREAAAETRKNLKKETDAENLAYQERLKSAGLFGLQKSLMTADQLELLAGLEKEHQERMNAINEKGNKAAIEKASQAQAEITKRQAAELAYRKKLINPENELIEQENEAHNQRLEKAGLFGKEREKLTSEQLKALETLEAIHRAKLNKVDADLIGQNLEVKQKAHELEISQLRYKNFQELNLATSFSNAKKILQGKLSADELKNIRTLDQAREEIKRLHLQEENNLTIKYGQDLMVQLKQAIDTGALDLEGIKLSDKILSDEEIEVLKEKFLKVSELMAGLKNPKPEKEEKSDYSFIDKKGGADILGFTSDDWEILFENLQSGKVGVEEMIMAVQALTNAYAAYSNLMAASEKKQLQVFEKSTNEKKSALDRQLNSGQISQEVYSKKVEALDAELDKKKAEIALKQAKREKQIQIMSAITGTASAVVGALGNKPWTPFNFVLASIVGAMGLAQIAAIVAAPMPGLEEGGYVTRAQDGEQFRAKNQGKKRGYIDETSVLVSENGREFVASAAAVANPDIKQVLDVIDSAQRNGDVNTLTLEKMFNVRAANRVMNGREMGGYVTDQKTAPPNIITSDPEIKALLKQNIAIQTKLSNQLERPIEANVSILGRNGFNEKMDEYNKTVEENNL